MRLYLSSFREGNKPEELLRLLGEGRRTALICNAMDMVEEDARADSNTREIERLKAIGLQPEEVDLRKYFGKPDQLRDALKGFDLIWARGGNVFVLRRAFRESGFDEILPELLAQDALVYGGYSAGVCVLAPTLRGLELVDNASEDSIWEGLGIVPYSIAPHYQSDHPESDDVDKVVEYFKAHNMPYKTLRDGEVIVIDDSGERIVA